MTYTLETRHSLSADGIQWADAQVYRDAAALTGIHDRQGLGLVALDEAGQPAGVINGFSWAGAAEIQQLFVEPAHRKVGLGTSLLTAFFAEADMRGVGRIWLRRLEIQAVGYFERVGFAQEARLDGWPMGQATVFMKRDL